MNRFGNFCSNCFHNLCGYGAAILMWIVAHMPQIDNVAQQLAIPLGVGVALSQLVLNVIWITKKIASLWDGADES